MTKERRLIAVSDGGMNKLFVGWTNLTDKEAFDHMQDGEPFILHDARVMREVNIPTPQGIVLSISVVPYAACREGIELPILATHYFWPEGADLEKLTEMIDKCKEDEVKTRAAAANIVTPDGMRVPGHPGGQRVG